jgi:hypothetical protein
LIHVIKVGTKLDTTANKKPHAFRALAGYEGNGVTSDCGSEHTARIAHAGELKKHSLQQARYLYTLNDESATHAAYRLGKCSSWMLFRHYYTADKIKLTKIETCGQHLLCPFCAAGRASRAAKAYLGRFEVIRALSPKLKPIMITLTVKNGGDLAERSQHLSRCLRTMLDRRRDSLKKGRGYCEFSKLEGLVYSMEVTRAKDGSWHPHVHMVAMAHSWLDHDKLSQEWQSITKDSTIVDIRRLKKDSLGGYSKSFAEVFKYALKFASMSHADTWHAFKTLKGRRLSGSVGCFRGVEVPEDPADLIDDVDGLPYLEMLYKYQHGSGYNLTSTRNVQPIPPDVAPDCVRACDCAEDAHGSGGDCLSAFCEGEGGYDERPNTTRERHKAQTLYAIQLLLRHLLESPPVPLSSEPERTVAARHRAVGCSLNSKLPPEATA